MILIALKFSLDFNRYSKFSIAIACFGRKKKVFKNKKQKKKLLMALNYVYKITIIEN